MLDIIFTPKEEEFKNSAEEYSQIWNEDKEKIVSALESFSGFKFIDTFIKVFIYEGVSFSGRKPENPMRLRASYESDVKKATLVHELGHRVLFSLDKDVWKGLDSHKVLNLFLYDVWISLYGKGFSDRMVEIEKSRGEIYQNAWNWALGFSEEERAKKLSQLIKQ